MINDDKQLRKEISEMIIKYLPTHDMRYMFLKILFKNSQSHIALEGSPIIAAYNMTEYFKSRDKLPELLEKLIEVFE